MEQEINQQDVNQNSWFQCIGQVNQSKLNLLLNDDAKNGKNLEMPKTDNPNSQDVQSNQQDQQNQLNQHKRALQWQSQQSSNQIKTTIKNTKNQSAKNNEQIKQQQNKAKNYSKTYRQRKKQKQSILQQENNYLKKKISDFQARLRQLQLEISRLKYAPPEKQLSIQQLNAQFLKKATIHEKSLEKTPEQIQKSLSENNIQFEKKFQDKLDQAFRVHGFGGSKKKQYLRYHMNQILEGVLRDSERYLMLLFSHSQNGQDIKPLVQYQAINQAFLYTIQQIDQDKLLRLKHFCQGLFPHYRQYQQLCSSLLITFQQIMNCCDKIHNFTKQTYHSKSRDLLLKRIKLQTWFQFNKHSKLLRQLKGHWLQLIKTGGRKNAQNQGVQNLSKKTKKKVSKNKQI